MTNDKKGITNQILRFLTIFVCIVTVGYIAIKYLRANSQDEELLLKETPINILDVKPIGKLYLYKTEVEEYETYNHEVSHWLESKDCYLCAQILRKQISWVFDLNSVEYETDSASNFVHIKMPPVKFEMSNHGEWFYNGGPEEVRHDANDLKRLINKKVEKKYNNIENQNKAQKRAQDFIKLFVEKCGKEPIFIINKNIE